MNPIAVVVLLGSTFAFAAHGAHVARAPEMARLLTFAACVLMGAALVAGLAEVSL